MSVTLLPRKDWKEQAAVMMKQITSCKLDMATMFPNNEHITGKSSPIQPLKDHLHKFFAKPAESLVPIEMLSNFLRQAPPEIMQEGEKSFKELKRLQQHTLYVQIQAKGFLDSREKTYARTKQMLGDLFSGGIGCPEAEKLKSILDENRLIEQSLSNSYLSLEQLDDLEGRLRRDKSPVDPLFAQSIAEKRVQFEKFNNQLLQLLSKNSLRCDELRKICEIIEQADNIRFRVSHFRHVCDIRDSFRWILLLDQFLDQSDCGQSRFKEMTEKIEFVDTSRPVDFENLRQRLHRFIDALERSGDLNFFKVILDPVKDIESTDPSIQGLIDSIRTARWSIIAKHKLATKSLSVDTLEELYRNAPISKKNSQDATFLKVKDLFNQLRLADNQLVLLLKDMRGFLSTTDEHKICSEESREKLQNFNRKMTDLGQIYETRLDAVDTGKKTERFGTCQGLLSALNCARAICAHELLSQDSLDDVEKLLTGDEDDNWQDFPLLERVLSCLSDKKIVSEFLVIVEQPQGADSSLEDKIDISTARKYIEIMKSDKNPIDYTVENRRIDSYVARFEAWEERALDFVQRYQIQDIEENYENFVREDLRLFSDEYNLLMDELKDLHFYSDVMTGLLALSMAVESMEYFKIKNKKRSEWEELLTRAKDVEEMVPDIVQRIEAEIEKSSAIDALIHECSKEKASYNLLRKLRQDSQNCAVNMRGEMAGCQEKLQIEEDLSFKLDSVLQGEHKLKLVDIEGINQEVRASKIDFEELAREINSTFQVCRAFVATIREMKKDPKDIKLARHLYSSLPLFSPIFENIVTQMEEEETTLEELESVLLKDAELSDFDKLSLMEAQLAQVKYYNVDFPKLYLFKQKVNLLYKATLLQESIFSLPYVVIKSMKQESGEFIKKIEFDEMLENVNIFLNEVDSEVKAYLSNLATNVKIPAALEKVKRTVMNIVDVSNEITDMHNKLKMQRPLQPAANWEVVNNKSKLGSLISKLPPPLAPRKDNSETLIVLRKPEEDTVPSYATTLSIRAVPDERAPDMLTLRAGMLATLRQELQKNPMINESEAECLNIAQTIERTLFSKSSDGSYTVKMPRILKLFQAINKLKKLTLLLVHKNYNTDLLTGLSELSPVALQEIENDKDKLLKTLATLQSNFPGIGNFQMLQPASVNSKDGDGVLRKRPPEVQGTMLTTMTSMFRRSQPSGQEPEEVVRLKTELDDYKIGRIKPKPPSNEDEDKNGSGDGLKDIVIEGGRKHARDADGNSDESRDGQYRIKRKRSGERMERGHADNGHSKGSPNKGKDMQPAWSIFKGTMSFEVKSESSMEVCLDYSDLITLEEKDKVNSFPKLPHRIEFKGPVEHQEFMGQLNKMIRRQDKQLNFMLGFVQSSGNMEFLANIIAKPHAAFHVRLTKYTRLFIFHKSSYNKAWHEPLEVASKKIYQANSEYYWLLIYNIAAAEKADVHLPGIEPHPIYSQNLFKKRPDRDDDETTGRSEGLTGSHIFDSNQLRVKHGQHPPRLDEAGLSGKFGSSYDTAPRGIKAQAPSLLSKGSSLLNVLKYGAGHDEEMVKPSHSMYSGIPQYDHMGTEITPPLLSMSFNQQRPGQFDYSEYTARGRSNGAVPGMHQGAGHAHSNIHLGHHYDDETAGKGRMGTLRNHFEMSGQGMHQPPGLPIWTAQKIGADSFRGQLMMDERGGPGFLSKQGVAPPYRDHVSDMLFKTQGGKKPQQQQQQQPPPALMLSMLKKRKVQKVKQNVYQGNYQEVDTVSSLEEESTKKKAAYKLQKGKKMPTGLNSGSLKRSGDHQDSSGVHHANSASHNILNMKQSGPGGPSLTAPPSKSLNHGGSQKYHDFGARGLEQGMADASYRQAGGLGPNFLHSLSIKPGMMSLKSMAQSITQQYDPHSRIHDSQLHGGLGGPHTSNGSQAKNGNNGQQQYKWPNNY